MFFKAGRPEAKTVARRAAILKAVVASAYTAPPQDIPEDIRKEWTPDAWKTFQASAKNFRQTVLHDLRKLKSSLTPWEQSFFAGLAGTLTAQQQVDATWRLEALQVLLWALGHIAAIPSYDEKAELDLLLSVPATAEAWLKSAKLRPQAEIDQARDDAELWHWRSRTRQLIEEGRPLSDEIKTAFASYDEIIKLTVAKAAEAGLTTIVNDDFSLMGKAYGDLSDEEWSEIKSITMERHFALNWLCGFAPKNQWDETPTET